MKRLALLTAAAFAAVALGVTPAAAQDTTRKDTTRKEAKGEVAKAPTATTIIVVIDNSAATMTKVGMFKADSAPKIELVDARPLVEGNPDEPKFKESLEKNKDAIKALQDELKKHDFVVKAINEHAQKPEPGDVIGAEVTDDGRLVLYFWKK
ncbi:MAG TPA: hypothetical protein VJ717_21055 [Gemmatimonadaceae bacterium]|nr:hypothetical protein [Gemmatimonadaceae bacterium]